MKEKKKEFFAHAADLEICISVFWLYIYQGMFSFYVRQNNLYRT